MTTKYNNEPKFIEINSRIEKVACNILTWEDSIEAKCDEVSPAICKLVKEFVGSKCDIDFKVRPSYKGDIRYIEIARNANDYEWEINLTLHTNRNDSFRSLGVRFPSYKEIRVDKDDYAQKEMIAVLNVLVANLKELEDKINFSFDFKTIDTLTSDIQTLYATRDELNNELNEYVNSRYMEDITKLIKVGTKINTSPHSNYNHIYRTIEKIMPKTFVFEGGYDRVRITDLVERVKNGYWVIDGFDPTK